MNRREFVKLGMITLATLWCVKVTEESVVAEATHSCYDCTKDFCSFDCSRWWNRPYFSGPGLPPIEQEIKTEELEYDCVSCPWYMCSSACPHYEKYAPLREMVLKLKT